MASRRLGRGAPVQVGVHDGQPTAAAPRERISNVGHRLQVGEWVEGNSSDGDPGRPDVSGWINC